MLRGHYPCHSRTGVCVLRVKGQKAPPPKKGGAVALALGEPEDNRAVVGQLLAAILTPGQDTVSLLTVQVL